MNLHLSIDINASKEAVWKVITDIDHSDETIEGILNVEILERPETGLIGLKWKETRIMFGKEASETMTIVKAEPNHFYETYAENHGMIYRSRMIVEEVDGRTKLAMSFSGEAQSFMAKMMSGIMSLFFKGATKKAVYKDLEDIKRKVEGLSS